MKGNPTAEAMQAVADAVHDLRADVRALTPAVPPAPPRGYVSDLVVPRWIAVAMRLCVNHETGESLAGMLKQVPPEYVTEGEEAVTVRCVCGAVHERAEVVECPGGCRRWFLGDPSGVWAVMLPEPTADAA